MRRAGVIVVLAASALVAVPASPASAAPPDVQITGLSSGTLTSGQRATLTFTVINKDQLGSANIKVTSSFGELTCANGCDFTDVIPPNGGGKSYTATLVAGNVPPGETKSGKIEVQAEIGGQSGRAERAMTVRGPEVQQPQTVTEISGRVTDIRTGDGIPGAVVAISDSANHRYDTITDDSGRYAFRGSAEKPITPGEILIGAQKDAVRVTKTISVAAGESRTGYRLVLRMAAPSATASPSAAPTPTMQPTLDTAAPTETAAAPDTAATGNDSGGFGSLMLILLGGLLIALGVGAIVLLWLRRKDNGDDDGVPVRPGGRPVRPAYAGMNDPTQLGGPAGAAPTMVGGAALADAPTMLQNRPAVDEFPDPYGAPVPPPQPPTYPGRPGWGEGYGDAATQLGPAPMEGRPSSGGGYGTAPSSGGGYGSPAAPGGAYGAGGEPFGAPAGGYGPPDQGDRRAQTGGWGRDSGYDDRHDAPTGRFRGDDGPGYGRGGREPDPYGGDPEPGYGRPPRHGNASGYSAQDDYRGGYNSRGHGGDTGGYDRGGYDRGGYERGGYDRVPEQRDAGYDDRGYDRGGYPDDPAGRGRQSPPSRRSERRSSDWLDD